MKGKKIITITLLLSVVFVISCSDSEIYGSWNTKYVKFDVKKASEILIERGMVISYATAYQFNHDNTFVMAISENEIDGDIERRYKGKMKIENNSLELITDTLYARKVDSEWEINIYKEVYKYTIEKASKNQILLKENINNGGFGYYTLERIEK